MKKIFFLGALLATFFCFTSAFLKAGVDETRNKYIFILTTQKECHQLLPLIDALYAHDEMPRVIAYSQAYTFLLKKRPNYYLYTIDTVNTTWGESKEYNEDLITSFADLFPKSRWVISGVGSLLQGKLLELFGKRGATTIAVWPYLTAEGFLISTKDPASKIVKDKAYDIAFAVQKKAKEVFVPSQLVKNHPKFQERAPDTISVLGNVTLDRFVKRVEQCNTESILQKLNLPLSQQTLLVLYSSNLQFQKKVFPLICSWIQELEQHEPVNTIIMAAPSSDEARMAKLKATISPNWRVIDKKDGIGIADAIACADRVICYDSGLALFATAARKKTVFVACEGNPYTNILIESKLTPIVQTKEEALHWVINFDDNEVDVYQTLGIPKNSFSLMYKAIK